MATDVKPDVAVTPGAEGVPTAGLVDLTMATDIDPAVAGPVGVLATDPGVPNLLLGRQRTTRKGKKE
jgi:hypothetical protein